MPRGGHNGIWVPTPKDIFKSRWKRFYKRCYRERQLFNNQPDKPFPHLQGKYGFHDGVPEPWRLMYNVKANFDSATYRQDFRIHGSYRRNLQLYMKPAVMCEDDSGRGAILRALDPGRHGTDSGLGRFELNRRLWMRGRDGAEDGAEQKKTERRASQVTDPVPSHIMSALIEAGKQTEAAVQKDAEESEHFPVRRLYSLIEEHDIVWRGGLQGESRQAVAQAGQEAEEGKADRGRFPYIDEEASLIDDLNLKEILRLGHRRSERRSPKWREIHYEHMKGKRSFLRRRQVWKDEVKAAMGVMRQE